MKLVFPKEHTAGELRTALILQTVKNFLSLGLEIIIESGYGTTLNISDQAFVAAGAKIEEDRQKLLQQADIVLRVNKPSKNELELLKDGCIHISFLDPFNEPELINTAAAKRISLISMEMIPRISRAQKMDALSSQTNLAGYAAVLVAANRLQYAFPMMMTAAGTISPANVFVIGVGVAGLQAIATAKRLGARVEAFDTRPSVAEQVQSLGAKFVKIDLGETGETKSGHAQAMTPEQLNKQRQEMTKICAHSHVVITTAQLFGKKAPTLVTKEMIAAMMPGSVIIDMAVSTGGNVEGVEINKEISINNVLIVGDPNLPSRVAVNASHMYSMNLFYLIENFWDKEQNNMLINLDDEIMHGCLLTYQGKIVNPLLL